jgi:hypothetical protein
MIDNFTKAEFEAALPPGLWTCLGWDAQSKQILYLVKPYPMLPYDILIFSSMTETGSMAGAGGDSIRCCILKDRQVIGGKPVRWIDRRPGWDKRLLNYLRALTNQISWLKSPCPGCGGLLVPLTSHTAKNPGRPFVKCETGCKQPFWAWTEDDNGEMIRPDKASQTAPVKPEAVECVPGFQVGAEALLQSVRAAIALLEGKRVLDAIDILKKLPAY